MIELRLQGAGAVVAKTRPDDPDASASLGRERDLLVDLDLPGTVRPTTDEITDEPALLLEPAGTATLAGSRPTAGDVRAIGRALADTLLSMHEQGIGHGGIEAEHVLWSPGQSPVLCGFGSAGPEVDPAEDVESLGRLLVSLTTDDDLLAAIERAGGDLRRLRSELGPTGAGPTLPRTAPLARPGRPARTPVPPIDRRIIVAVGAAVAVLALAGGALALTRGDDLGGAESPIDAPPPAPTTTTVAPTTAPAMTVPPTTVGDDGALVWPPEADCPSIPEERIGVTDLDLDGCPDAVVRQDDELHVGDRRFRLGTADDIVLVGDWRCDGLPTPALVTRSDGAVHPFPDWPIDAPLDVEAVAVLGPVADASTSVVDGCDTLTVELADGSTEQVTW